MSYSNEPALIKAFNQSLRFESVVNVYAEQGYPGAENLIYAFYYKLANKNKRWKADEPNLAGWTVLMVNSFNKDHMADIRAKFAEFSEANKNTAIMACAIAFAEFSLECFDRDHTQLRSVLPDLWDLSDREENQGLLFDYKNAEREIELSLRYGLPSRASERIVENNAYIERDLEFVKHFLNYNSHSDKARVEVACKIYSMIRSGEDRSPGRGSAELITDGQIPASKPLSIDTLLDNLSMSNISQVVAALGYMQQAKNRVKAKSKDDISKEEKGLELGNNITKILPEEFAKTPIDFCLSFAESKLWQRASISTKGKKGDFFVLFDASSSMTNTCHGILRSAWGKAFVLTAADVVTKTKGRKIHIIPFTGDVWKDACFTVDGSQESKNKLLAFEPSGGATNWGNPLYYAVRKMREQEDRDILKHKCDVLYITDADDFARNNLEVSDLKAQMNFEIHVVLINDDEDSEKGLNSFADKVINIAKLISPEAIAEAATNLIIDYE